MTMKKHRNILFLSALLLCWLPSALQAQTVTFNNSHVEFDAMKGSQKGICFHCDITAQGYTGQDLLAVVFVNDSKSGWMKSHHSSYRTAGGLVCTMQPVSCTDAVQRWSDLQLFLPYTAMSLANEESVYSYSISMMTPDGQSIIKTDAEHRFDWSGHSPSAYVYDMWAEMDHTRGKEKGLLVHADLQVNNYLNNEVQIYCYVTDGKGTPVATTDNRYSTPDQHLKTDTLETIGHRTAHWADYKKLFIPYSAFPQGVGRQMYHLTLVIRDPARGFVPMATGEPTQVYVTGSAGPAMAAAQASQSTMRPQNTQTRKDCKTPTITWKSAYESTTPDFYVTAGINSESEVTATGLLINGNATRGMRPVHNDGFDMTIDEKVTLAEGDNIITVTAVNACGSRTHPVKVTYNKPAPVNVNPQRRIALVIGNSAYSSRALANPVNDATDISTALTQLGFDVQTVINGTQREMREAIDKLQTRAEAGGVALFYYSGHGMQADGENYLIPVDAEITNANDLQYDAVNVGKVLGKLNASGCMMNMLVLDACRDNPFENSWTRSQGGNGLANINAGGLGTLILYSTAAGKVAQDGTGRNSPFTTAFLNALKIPGLDHHEFIDQVIIDVVNATNNTQQPWTSGSVLGKFYFNPKQ